MNSSINNAVLFLGICLIISSFGMNGVIKAEDCNVTLDDWNKSPVHDKYKTFDEFKKACNDLLTQTQIIGGILPYLAMVCIIIWGIATFKKSKANQKTKEKEGSLK